MLDISKLPPSKIANVVDPLWRFEPHLQQIEKDIVNLYKNDATNNLMLQIPLGHGKTAYVCRLLAFDLLLHNPDEQIIIATYSADFAAESIAKVRDWIDQWGYKLGHISVDPSWGGKGFFRLKGRNGFIRGVGVGTKFGGSDATTILVDDILSDPQDALSQTMRSSIETWWSGQLMGRKRANPIHEPKTIFIGTPKHPEDISMKIEASNKDLPPDEKWIIHRMPAIRVEEDEDGTKKLLALSPRYPLEKLRSIKQRYDSLGQAHLWQTLYMCNPQISKYASFLPEWLPNVGTRSAIACIGTNFWYESDLRPWIYENTILKTVTCDPSISGTGDYTAILTCHVVRHNDESLHIYVDKHFRKQCVIPEARAALSEILLRDRPDAASCEATGFQRIIAIDVNDEVAKSGFLAKVTQFNPPKSTGGNSKDRIVTTLSDILADGRLHLFHCGENIEMRAEAIASPDGDHDDSIDCLSQAVYLINNMLF